MTAKNGELTLMDNMVKFINTKRIEASMPESWRKRKVRLDGYERIGGMTNRNYKIFVGNETLVLRLPGRGTGRFISRADEKANQEAATAAGYAPESVYFNKKNGVKITPFLSDAIALTPQTARDPDLYRELALFLACFHSSGITCANHFDVFKKIRTYERIAMSRLARFYPGYRQHRPAILHLENLLKAMPIPAKPCHNDLVPENILIHQDRFQLIDWEYSGINDPAWDIGSFLLESEMPPADAQAFVQTYLDALAAHEQTDHVDTEASFLWRVRAYQILQDALWALWSLIQASAAPKQAHDYQRYGALRFERCCAMLQSIGDAS